MESNYCASCDKYYSSSNSLKKHTLTIMHKTNVQNGAPTRIDKTCKYEGCDMESPKFNHVAEIKGIYCKKHKENDMINVVDKIFCNHFGCTSSPFYNFKNKKRGIYCVKHKEKDMVNITDISRGCLICGKQACFNFSSETKGIYCVEHKKETMIDVFNKHRLFEGCNTLPIYNNIGKKVGAYCVKHKKDDMVDVRHKKCQYDTCIKRPTYNTPENSNAIFCSNHKKGGMINVTEKRICKYPNCGKRPNYNLPHEPKGVYCFNHKDDNMIDVAHKKCEYPDCNKRPNYNATTEISGIYCFEHKKSGMIDITSKFCQFPKCRDDALYGNPSSKPHFCEKHKKTRMVNLVLASKCSMHECDKKHEIEYEGKKYCILHCPDKNCEAVLKKRCKYCDLVDTNFVCRECEEKQNKKEWMVVKYIKKNIKTPFVHDTSSMLQSCSKRRPDVYFDLDLHCVIVEIDENQHKSYQEICECARLSEIVGSIGGRSIIFIRFNPDKIKNNKKEINIGMELRLAKLTEIINTEILKKYDVFIVKLIQLYYDDDYTEYTPIKSEDITCRVAI